MITSVSFFPLTQKRQYKNDTSKRKNKSIVLNTDTTKKIVIPTIKLAVGLYLLSIATFYSGIQLVKTRKYDETLNKIFADISKLKSNKIISSFLKLPSKYNKFIMHKIFKKEFQTKEMLYDFSKARSHIKNIGTNNKGKISGAHELGECIKTLKNESGNIISISQSKTKNGIWEIMYEIKEIKAQEPKSIYLKNIPSLDMIKDLIALCSKHKNSTLDIELGSLIQDKKTISYSEIVDMAEKALKKGYVFRTPSLDNKTYDAMIHLEKLKSQLDYYNSELKRQLELQKSANKLLSDFKAKNDSQTLKNNDEFKNILKNSQSVNKCINTIKSEIQSLQMGIPVAEKHYNQLKNSLILCGVENGRLFGGYAHYKDKKYAVDSYFPIAHGSNFQEEFLNMLSRKGPRSIEDMQYLISAKDIGKFSDKLSKKAMEKPSLFIRTPVGLGFLFEQWLSLKEIFKTYKDKKEEE